MTQRQMLQIMKGVISAGAAVFRPGGEVIEVPFNPNEYTLSAQNNFGEAAVVGLASPVIQFGGGQARSLNFELLVDTLAYHGGQDAHATLIAQLEGLLDLVPGLGSPPPCRVSWGAGLSFVGLLESLESRYEHFLSDGTPVRARVSLRFKEIQRGPAATPRSLRAPEVAALLAGESLPSLAERHTGDARNWREIAQRNNIDRPRTVPAGRTLKVR